MYVKSLVFIISILLFYNYSFAYDDEVTHPYITDFAVQIFTKKDTYLKRNLGIDGDFKSVINGKPILNWLVKGSIDEDSPNCRAASHFLDPLKDWSIAGVSDTTETISGYIPDEWCFATNLLSSRFSIHKYSAVTWATGYTSPPTISSQSIVTGNGMDWNAARSYYYLALTATSNDAREEYFAQTFQTLGQVLHLLQDMAVPAHVRNDFTAHLGFQKMGKSSPNKWFGNTYEWLLKDKTLIASALANVQPIEFPTNKILTSFWDADTYNGSNPSVGDDQGLAEYTNANFFSESTIFAELKDPDDIHYFPRPARADTNAQEQEMRAAAMEVTAEDGLREKVLFITKDNDDYKMAAYSFLKKWVNYQIIDNGYIPQEVSGYIYDWQYNLNDEVYKDYAKKLLPRAVGYSAGLVNYFFRGQMETTALERMDDSGNVTELLVNVTNKTANETMKNGYFTLAYRYKPSGSTQYVYGTQLFPLDEMAYDSSKQLTFKFSEYNPDYPSQTTLSPIPAGATDKQYTLVFYGTLGNETNAVVGKVFEPTPAAIDITRPGRFVYALADDGGPHRPKASKSFGQSSGTMLRPLR